MAFKTRSLVALLIFELPFMTRDTVDSLTAQCLATSEIVIMISPADSLCKLHYQYSIVIMLCKYSAVTYAN